MSGFFDGIAQEEVTFGRFTGKAPMFFREVRMMAGVFTASLSAARALMPTPLHHALRVFPGRAVAAVHCMEYLDTDIGPYNEVSLSVAIAHGRRPFFGMARLFAASVRRDYHAHVIELPVTTEAALAGGVEVLGFPKYLAEIAFEETPAHRVCTVRDPATKEVIVRVPGEMVETRRWDRQMMFHSYPIKNGQTLHARISMNLIECGASTLHSRMSVEPGAHPRARAFSDLRLGRQLQYFYGTRCEAILFRPEPVRPTTSK